VLVDHFEQVVARDHILERTVYKSIPRQLTGPDLRNSTMAAILSISSATLRCPKKNESGIFLADGIDNLSLPLIRRGQLFSLGMRLLGVDLRKVGRFVVKCLSDAAMDSTMMWF
jgi:hypothetical protein